MAGSGLPPLSNIPLCCLPSESGPCLSPSVADHPLRPATDRRLGRPLPHQLANLTRAHPIVQGPKIPCFPPQGVCGINPSFPGLSPATGRSEEHTSELQSRGHLVCRLLLEIYNSSTATKSK